MLLQLTGVVPSVIATVPVPDTVVVNFLLITVGVKVIAQVVSSAKVILFALTVTLVEGVLVK